MRETESALLQRRMQAQGPALGERSTLHPKTSQDRRQEQLQLRVEAAFHIIQESGQPRGLLGGDGLILPVWGGGYENLYTHKS